MSDTERRGLSPSSLATYLSCPKKYWHYKVGKTKADSDVADDVESLQVGKAFHKCLEDTRHDLAGYTYPSVQSVVKDHDLSDDFHAPLIMAMLGKYKAVHAMAGLRAIECEVPISTEAFFGVADVILQSPSGDWWIGDVKTAASFSSALVPTLLSHPQLNLYAAHAPVLAKELSLDLKAFRGCRYLLTTKSKIGRKAGEGTVEFIGRLSKAVKSYNFSLPREKMVTDRVVEIHTAAAKFISTNREPDAYARNYGSCTQYFRPCAYWSQCHGHLVTEMPSLEVLASD
jgi:hypothetical protein